MTNTLHRQGQANDLKNDYVIFATTAKGITREGSAPKIQEFMRICQRHHPVNIGDGKQGNILQDDVDIQRLISNQGDGAGAAAVFTDLDTLQQVVGELIRADLGISINISGLVDEVQECCRKNGIERHASSTLWVSGAQRTIYRKGTFWNSTRFVATVWSPLTSFEK